MNSAVECLGFAAVGVPKRNIAMAMEGAVSFANFFTGFCRNTFRKFDSIDRHGTH